MTCLPSPNAFAICLTDYSRNSRCKGAAETANTATRGYSSSYGKGKAVSIHACRNVQRSTKSFTAAYAEVHGRTGQSGYILRS